MKLSMSGMERADACPPSLVLPHTRKVTQASTLGHTVHEYLCHVSVLGVPEALARVPEEFRPACESIDLSRLPACEPEAYAAEVAFLYDVREDTARELGRGMGRAYPPHEAWQVPGTADVVGLTADSVIIIDYKTGWAPVAPAASNVQLAAYALAAARAYNRTRATVAICRLHDGDVWWDKADLDELDLEAAAARFRDVLVRADEESASVAAGNAPRTVEGAHCQFCPAFASCPAKANLARALGGGEPLTLAPLTLETFPSVLERLEAAEEVLGRVRANLEDFARATPVPLPSGEVYGPVTVTRETLDAQRAAILLTERFGADVARHAVRTEATCTKADLNEALRSWMREHPGHRLTKLVAEVLDGLRKAGGVAVRRTHPVKRHTPQVADAA
ncbi:DUF2800 domain-containing protein [Myxococcus sp. CA040A]|uniref:DUF2800 domain-containing protein n=1 Tax=Myxococcus sp. CA040A TaxID=2741738 RepID=UPI00157A3A1B|nr:DUF2800 domain-containing protein [Myxococcus sp. CA040A]NTX08960.1 DUF2800 domain-containing protein [Myxococcus sp. CA040A]